VFCVVQHLFSFIFTLSKDFLRGVEHFAGRGTILWNIFGVVEHFRGTFRASWNNPARPGVEQFAHRGTFSWNNFGVVEQFFFKKKGLTLFFSRSNYAPFRGTIRAPWNNLACQVQFLGEYFL
jgi:hypothetical protein